MICARRLFTGECDISHAASRNIKSASSIALLCIGLSWIGSGAVLAYVISNPAAMVLPPELMEKT